MNDSKIKYSIVVPVFNEELVIAESYKRLKAVLQTLNETYEIIFINDGSNDNSLYILKEICRNDGTVRTINLSRNFGHQVAITAGMDHSTGEAVVIIDADLQDPPQVILDMIKKWKEGFEVVYGKRTRRLGESFFKRITAKLFYRTLKSMINVDIPVDTGDFRLIDRKVCDALKTIPERNRYVRGLVSWVGFRQTGVEYVREERFAGTTKYPLRKMLKFATDAVASFSYKPLKLATFAGITISLTSFLFIILVLFEKLFTNLTIPGWTSLIAINLFFNGIILIIMGIFGEYIGRIYDEAKKRPLYIVSEEIGFEADGDKHA